MTPSARSTPAAAISDSTSSRNGCQLRIPRKTGRSGPPAARRAPQARRLAPADLRSAATGRRTARSAAPRPRCAPAGPGARGGRCAGTAGCRLAVAAPRIPTSSTASKGVEESGTDHDDTICAAARRAATTMPKLAASVTMLFNEWPLLDRFEQAAGAGFAAVEIQEPYGESKERRRGARARARSGAGADERRPGGGRRARPGGGVPRGIRAGAGVRRGGRLPAAPLPGRLQRRGGFAEAAFVANLRWAAAAAPAGMRLLIEPLNTRDNPGYFLTGIRAGAPRPRSGGGGQRLPAVRLLPHADHGGRPRDDGPGDTSTSLRTIQVGGVPGRHEPDGVAGRSTIPTCSTSSTTSASRAGSAASTAPPPARSRASAGRCRTASSPPGAPRLPGNGPGTRPPAAPIHRSAGAAREPARRKRAREQAEVPGRRSAGRPRTLQ